jgi:hypothetical protein
MPALARRAIAAARGNPSWAILGLAVQLWASRGYDYFRDEMYFIVCGDRLDWGFVDQPPLIPAVAATMHHLFPGSLVMLRLLPALAHAATIVLAAATARQLGGGVWAQAIAALCVLTGGVFLGIGTTLSTGALEPLAGLFCAYTLIRIIRGKDERFWLAMGIAAGIALQEKYLIAFWLAGLGLGLIATPARRVFLSPYICAGAVIAAMIPLPNLLWQAANRWPFREMGRVAVERKNVVMPPLEFLWQMIQQFNEAGGVVWLSGLVGFAVWRRFADLRRYLDRSPPVIWRSYLAGSTRPTSSISASNAACRSKAWRSAAASTASYQRPTRASNTARWLRDALRNALSIDGSAGMRTSEALATMSRDRAFGLRITDTDQV